MLHEGHYVVIEDGAFGARRAYVIPQAGVWVVSQLFLKRTNVFHFSVFPSSLVQFRGVEVDVLCDPSEVRIPVYVS